MHNILSYFTKDINDNFEKKLYTIIKIKNNTLIIRYKRQILYIYHINEQFINNKLIHVSKNVNPNRLITKRIIKTNRYKELYRQVKYFYRIAKYMIKFLIIYSYQNKHFAKLFYNKKIFIRLLDRRKHYKYINIQVFIINKYELNYFSKLNTLYILNN
jgi:hypothetical protein